MLRIVIMLLCMFTLSMDATATSLKGSPAAVQAAYKMAKQEGLSFLQTGAQIKRFVAKGWRVHIALNSSLELSNVSYPFATKTTKLFAERLSVQYRQACGNKLIITSLMRPIEDQPKNASKFSVHPTGAALDLRVPTAECGKWLRRVLISLEKRGVIDATREKYPPHYHVVVYQSAYARYVSGKTQKPSVVPWNKLLSIGVVIGVSIAALFSVWNWWKFTKYPTYSNKIRSIKKHVLWYIRGFWILPALLFVLVFEPFSPIYWLTLTSFHEARGESFRGRWAVTSVVFNRRDHGKFPGTIRGVVTDGLERGKLCDFSYYCDGKSDRTWITYRYLGTWVQFKLESTLHAMAPRLFDSTSGSLYYKRSDVQSDWFTRRIVDGRFVRVVTIGAHEFFRLKK